MFAAEAAASEKRTAPWDRDFQQSDWPEFEDAPGWEEWYYQNSELHYRNEVTGYACLTSMQGSVIPHFFATGRLALQQRTISPHVILVEYLPDVKTLKDIDPSLVELLLAQSLLATVRTFAKIGFVYSDLNLTNTLLVPGTQLVCAVIIDLTESGIREDKSDEVWQQIVTCKDDASWMKKQLEQTLGITFD
ncbi:hypothetical protein H0H81_003494 [Sphagnurus paluster]|uniref:Uncharacterized protein n=1 Tax=Sphagnurus paluster TaxID=117069 RepID=A0A9P7GH22_9AGAR|nr:hypothetical protein H0H81_003494 [Sphagnurus paluster]